MKPGFYLVEHRRDAQRTIIAIDREVGVEWMGGDQTSSVEDMLKEFRVIREVSTEGDGELESARL